MVEGETAFSRVVKVAGDMFKEEGPKAFCASGLFLLPFLLPALPPSRADSLYRNLARQTKESLLESSESRLVRPLRPSPLLPALLSFPPSSSPVFLPPLTPSLSLLGSPCTGQAIVFTVRPDPLLPVIFRRADRFICSVGRRWQVYERVKSIIEHMKESELGAGYEE